MHIYQNKRGAENDGHETDRTDQFSGYETAGHKSARYETSSCLRSASKHAFRSSTRDLTQENGVPRRRHVIHSVGAHTDALLPPRRVNHAATKSRRRPVIGHGIRLPAAATRTSQATLSVVDNCCEVSDRAARRRRTCDHARFCAIVIIIGIFSVA